MLNMKSNAVYKKGSYNSTSLLGKTTMSYDFELEGEDEIKPTSSVTFSASLRIYVKFGTLQNRRAFVLIEHIHLFILMTDRFAK